MLNFLSNTEYSENSLKFHNFNYIIIFDKTQAILENFLIFRFFNIIVDFLLGYVCSHFLPNFEFFKPQNYFIYIIASKWLKRLKN